MQIEGERIFVTGGTGFIGRHLVQALVDRGATCVVFDRERRHGIPRDRLEAGTLEFIQGDMLHADLAGAMQGCTAICHLAAGPDVRTTEDRPREAFEQNVLATARLLDAMDAAKVKKLGFASTSTVYGEATVLPTPEDYTPLAPVSVYGASKLAAEGLIRGYASYAGLTVVIFRLANVVGGGATHGVIYDFVRKLRANARELKIFGREPGTHKSYVHIEDAVEAVLHGWAAVDRGVEVFNVGSPDTTSVKEIADIVCRAMDATDVRYRWTGGVDGGGWKGDVRSMWLAVDKLMARGWRPRRTSAEAAARAATEALASP